MTRGRGAVRVAHPPRTHSPTLPDRERAVPCAWHCGRWTFRNDGVCDDPECRVNEDSYRAGRGRRS